MRTMLRKFVVLCLLLAAAPLAAQEWAGRGRLQGKLVDEQGKPIEGAQIVLRNTGERVDPATPGPEPVISDAKGKWSILGLAGGDWGILISKEGFMPSEGRVKVSEFGPAQPINVTLNKPTQQQIQEVAGPDAEARAALEKGNQLLLEAEADPAKYAQARAAYEEGLAKLTDTTLHPSIYRAIAGTYYREKQSEPAIAALQKGLAIAPDDVESLKMIVTLLSAAGRDAEAQQYMAKLPQDAEIDPAVVLNMGINAYNENKMEEAFKHFEAAVAAHPGDPEPYYYRGLVHLNQGRNAEAKADFQKFLEIAPDHARAAEVKDFLANL